MDHCLPGRINLIHPRYNMGQWNKLRFWYPGDFVLVRLAHIDDLNIVISQLTLTELERTDLFQLRLILGRLRLQSAKLFVIDQRLDRRIGAADRAVGIFTKLELPEFHLPRIEQEQAI